MKESKHHLDTFENALEKIEQFVEKLDPAATVNVNDITCRANLEEQSSKLTEATIMLLQKYGIPYRKVGEIHF